MKKTLFVALAVASFAFSASATDGINAIFVHKTDGTTLSSTFDQTALLKFLDDNLSLSIEENIPTSIALDNIAKITFGHQDTSTSVESVSDKEFDLFVYDGNLSLKSSEPISSVSLYSLQGQCVSTVAADGREFSCPVSELKGVYIVRVTTTQGVFSSKVLFR